MHFVSINPISCTSAVGKQEERSIIPLRQIVTYLISSSLGTSVTMIPTPDLSHLTQNDYDLVYEPAGTKTNPHPFPSKSRTSRLHIVLLL